MTPRLLGDIGVTHVRFAGPAHAQMPPGDIASPVTGGAVRMTNHDGSFSMAVPKRELDCEQLLVISDLTAQALDAALAVTFRRRSGSTP